MAASSKRDEARAALPPVLREVYDQLVDEYRYHTVKVYGKPFVSYEVLAELVKTSWRPSEEAMKQYREAKLAQGKGDTGAGDA